ncbi:hypothetical protein BC629DRAFT_1649115 [Irpex lacteus]|nr:hypothetical protein BC629DRAFT_1649115 [Irpex lacteus]
MRFALAALALVPSALGALTINAPSGQSYWVQNTSNTITWQFTSGDPSPVDILVVNSDNATLNGPFSIAQFVDTSAETFTVTNVTLKVGSGFEVQFVSPQNHSQVFATAPTSTSRPQAVPAPAATSTSNGTSSASASGSASGSGAPSASNSASASVTRPPPAETNGAASVFGVNGIFGVVAACGVASIAIIL